jgi:hypothetical protein
MDIFNILEQLKQKGLDVVQVELLKNAYELQNRNLEQLKENNDALRESNNLLKEKVENLLKEREVLLIQMKSFQNVDSCAELSDMAKAVLAECIRADMTKFNNESMIETLNKYSRMQLEAAFGELSKKKYIAQSSAVGFGRGFYYRLTQSGKEYSLSLKSTS